MDGVVLSPTDFVALTNQTLEFATPRLTVSGEIGDLRISKGQWLYFNLVDDYASVKCFGTIYMMPASLENGMTIKVVGASKLHPRFNFSFNAQTIELVGEGTIQKAYEKLLAKIVAEGLTEESRKRALPYPPQHLGVITSSGSAAEADVQKVLAARWPGLKITLYNSFVQGAQAPESLVKSITQANQADHDVILITRGGGSAEDLAAFNDERVVRAVAASRVPTMVAIGHEVDESLSELVADARASTPSNAAEQLVPSVNAELTLIVNYAKQLATAVTAQLQRAQFYNEESKSRLDALLLNILQREDSYINLAKTKINLYNPQTILKKGYSVISFNSKVVRSVKDVSKGDPLDLRVVDGLINARVE